MAFMGPTSATEFWSKCKAWFGRKLGASTTATTVSIQLKNNAGDNLGDAATISAATTTAAGAMSADDKTKLNGIETGANNYSHPTTTAVAAAAKKVGNDAAGHVVLGDSLTASDVGAAASTHAHGDITSGGDITAEAPTVASGDKLIINDESASKVTNGPSFGTSTTTYLRNDGSWGTPAGTYDHPTSGPSSTASTSKGDTTAQTPTWGGTFKVTSETVDKYGHTTALAEHNVTIPSATATASSGGTGGSAGLMSAADKEKLNGIASGATANTGTVTKVSTGAGLTGGDVTTTGTVKCDLVSETKLSNAAAAATETAGRVYPVALDKNGDLAVNVPWTDSDTKALSEMTGTLAVSQGGTGATSAADARTELSVYSKAEVDSLLTSGANFKGTLGESGADYTQAQLEASAYKAGWYWVVKAAGTFVGQTCEAGDMVYAVKNKASAYAASDFTVVQNNMVEMTVAEVDAICV